MLYSDYLKYFDTVVINHSLDGRKYYNEELKYNISNNQAQKYHMEVQKEGIYHIQVEQNDMMPKQPYTQYSRTTILVLKDNSNSTISDYEYVDGLLKYN